MGASERESFRKWLVNGCGGCNIQDGAGGKGWPCGTCVIDLFDRIGLTPDDPMYHERNEEPDRANEIWRAILQIRDAKLSKKEKVAKV